MGCNPIVFAGLDLAFTGMRPYCAGTVYHEMWQTYVDAGCPWDLLMQEFFKNQPEVQAPDLHGKATRTAPQMLAFRDWLLDAMTARPDRTYVNATGAGILHGTSLSQASLDAVLGHAPAVDVPIRARLQSAHTTSRPTVSPQLPAAVDELLRQRNSRAFERWIEFTLHTVSEGDIRAMLEQSRTALA
jgi:hypothetical protein